MKEKLTEKDYTRLKNLLCPVEGIIKANAVETYNFYVVNLLLEMVMLIHGKLKTQKEIEQWKEKTLQV